MPAGDLSDNITAFAAFVAAAGAIIATVLGYRNNAEARKAAEAALIAKQAAEDSKTEIIATKEGVFEVGRQIDGRLTQLLASTEKMARAEGFAEGEQAQRIRTAEA